MGFLGNLLKGLLGIRDDAERFGDRASRQSKYSFDPDERVKNIEHAVTTIFEGYEVKHKVPVTAFGNYESNFKFAHVVYDTDGRAKLAVLILGNSSHKKTRHFYNAKQACEDNGIPFVFFYDYMPNEAEYVENRIRTSL